MPGHPRSPAHVSQAGSAAALAAVVLLVGGCSTGDDGSQVEPSAAPTTASDPASAPTSPEPATPTAVALGRPATVTVAARDRRGELAVTVTRVREGRIKDLSDFVLDRRTRRSTPYYADVRVENTGGTALSGASVALWGLDSTDTVLPAAQIRGTFGRCDGTPLPKRFAAGATARTCLLFLVPHGATLQAVQYRPTDETSGPITWPTG